MSSYLTRLEALESQYAPAVPPLLVVLVKPGEDRKEAKARAIAGAGLTPAQARTVVIVTFEGADAEL